MAKMTADALGFASLYNRSRHVDWSEFDRDEWRVILPDAPEEALDDYWPEWREECADLDEARKSFDQQERFYEWEDSFAPMMNYLWPVHMVYGGSPSELATAIDKAGIAITLIELDDENKHGCDYGFALSGGGMDLSWHIATAYVLAGQVPPFVLMENLSRPCDAKGEMRELILGAAAHGEEAMKSRAERMHEAVRRASKE